MKITPCPQLVSGLESGLGAGMSNFLRGGYRGVTETWNVIQHEVDSVKATVGGLKNCHSMRVLRVLTLS